MQLKIILGLLLLDVRDNVVSQRTIHGFGQFVISKGLFGSMGLHSSPSILVPFSPFGGWLKGTKSPFSPSFSPPVWQFRD
jgi:hypothetical protein